MRICVFAWGAGGGGKQALTESMDEMLAPFIRISHNMAGKGDQNRLGTSTLTDEELASIHKYTSVLLKSKFVLDLFKILDPTVHLCK